MDVTLANSIIYRNIILKERTMAEKDSFVFYVNTSIATKKPTRTTPI